jgi:hypothetical protein
MRSYTAVVLVPMVQAHISTVVALVVPVVEVALAIPPVVLAEPELHFKEIAEPEGKTLMWLEAAVALVPLLVPQTVGLE